MAKKDIERDLREIRDHQSQIEERWENDELWKLLSQLFDSLYRLLETPGLSTGAAVAVSALAALGALRSFFTDQNHIDLIMKMKWGGLIIVSALAIMCIVGKLMNYFGN